MGESLGRGLGRELVRAGLLKEAQLQEAERYQDETGGSLARILVKLRFVGETDLLELIAKQEGLEIVKLEDAELDEEIVRKLPPELVQKHELVPLSHDATYLKLALPDPYDLMAIDDVRFRTGLEVQMMLISESDALKVLSKYYNKYIEPPPVPSRSHRRTEARRIVRRVGQEVAAAEAARMVGSMLNLPGASPAKLIRVLTTILIDKGVVTADELKDRLRVME